MTILVTTPTGHTGSRVVKRLLAMGTSVSVLARHPHKLSKEVLEQVIVHQGSLEDAAAVERAMAGVKALFYVLPLDLAADLRASQRRLAEIAAAAIRQQTVKHVVFLSSAGAHRYDHGPVSGNGEAERLFASATPNFLALRCAYFMENFILALPMLAQSGVIYGAFPPDLQFPMVATRDIGDVVVARLFDRSWSGHQVQGVHGPADLSMAEAAAIFSDVFQRQVQYAPISMEQMAATLTNFGMSSLAVDAWIEMLRGQIATGFEHTEPRTAATTTPTTLAAFAREVLRPALANGSVAQEAQGNDVLAMGASSSLFNGGAK